MLEQLDVAPGHRVLKIGAATGINAALLAELVGPTGTVVTIELDDDLAARDSGAVRLASAWSAPAGFVEGEHLGPPRASVVILPQVSSQEQIRLTASAWLPRRSRA